MKHVVNSYRNLVVWQQGMGLALTVYRLTERFPPHERYGLTSQLRRCSVSIPSNIAEGHSRASTREYLRHISIAMGSLAERETQLILGKELGYFASTDAAEAHADCDLLGKRLRSPSKSLRTRVNRDRKG
jgi:four helix bundle protein